MAGGKRKDFNELVPDMIDCINCGDDTQAREYFKWMIVNHLFRDLKGLTREKQDKRIAYRARVLRNVVKKVVA